MSDTSEDILLVVDHAGFEKRAGADLTLLLNSDQSASGIKPYTEERTPDPGEFPGTSAPDGRSLTDYQPIGRLPRCRSMRMSFT